MPQNQKTHPAVPPRGIYRSQVDSNGRLELPREFRRFLSDLRDTTVFSTSFDELTVRVYPVSVWTREVRPLLETSGELADIAEDLCFTANRLGLDSQLDRKGCILLSAELRQALNLDSQPVYIEHQRGHFNVFTDSVYQQRRERARQDLARKLHELQRQGLR